MGRNSIGESRGCRSFVGSGSDGVYSVSSSGSVDSDPQGPSAPAPSLFTHDSRVPGGSPQRPEISTQRLVGAVKPEETIIIPISR